MKSKVSIRDVREEDFDFILALNKTNVEVLSPMNMENLKNFIKTSNLFLVAEVDGQPAGFLIALREGVDDYESENYRWFSNKYSNFLYIDRVVIDEKFRSKGVGKKFYDAVKQTAEDDGVERVTAEIDIVPYNEASLKFHTAMGFKEVGIQWVRNRTVKVSLQVAEPTK